MGNKQGGGGITMSDPGADLYDQTRAKQNTLRDKQLAAEARKAASIDVNSNNNNDDDNKSDGGFQPLKGPSSDEIQTSKSVFGQDMFDLIVNESKVASRAKTFPEQKPVKSRKPKAKPKAQKKPKTKDKKKPKKVYTPSGYDLTPAYNITPDERIINGVGIDHVYDSIRVIAEGGSCSVLEVIEKKTGRKFALKQMLSDHKYNPSMYEQEIKALIQLKSQVNVLSHHDHWMDRESLYLITEFCAGGSLLDKILGMEQFCEELAAEFISCVLKAIAFMHSHNLIHRDLKPENIVFSEDPYGNDVLKIIDFGDSITLPDGDYTTIYAGTRPYMAPQLFKTKAKQYFTHLNSQDRKRYYRAELKKADVWSIGVIAYVLVCGRLPFNGSRNQLPALICRGKFRFPRDIELSSACKSFIRSLLVFDPDERLSAKQALEHPWLVGQASKQSLGPTFHKTLHEFNATTKLTKLLVKTIWNVASDSERKLIKFGLKKITAESEGVLTAEQMFDYMMNFCHVNENQQFYVECTAEELENLMEIPDGGVHIDKIDIGGLMSSFSLARGATMYGGQGPTEAAKKLSTIESDDNRRSSKMKEKDAQEKRVLFEKMIVEHNKMVGKAGTQYDPEKLADKVTTADGDIDPTMAWSADIDDAETKKKKKRSKSNKNKNKNKSKSSK